jgi:hypothetical protein
MGSRFERTAAEALAQARQVLTLDALIVKLTGATLDKHAPCLFCEKKGKFGLFSRGGNRLYKCFNASCRAHTTGDDVAFIMLWCNLDRKAAFKEFLKLAGVS